MGRSLMRRAGADSRARRLVRWYPKEWRVRYGEEFTQLLTDDISERPRSWRRTLDVARSGLAAQMAQRQLTRWRLTAAALIFGGALTVAAVLHAVVDPNQQIVCPHGRNPHAECLIVPGHGWANPVALGIALLGVAAASGVLLAVLLRPVHCRIVAAAAIVGVGVALVVWVAAYRAVVSGGLAGSPPVFYPTPAWTAADAALIALAAVGVALVVLRRHRPMTRLRLVGVVLVLGVALAGAAVPHVVRDPGGSFGCFSVPAGFTGSCHMLGPQWVDPAMLALCALAAAVAAGLLVTSRRRA
jgi:hypothetical protein